MRNAISVKVEDEGTKLVKILQFQRLF